MRFSFIQRWRLSYSIMKPLVAAQVTIVPPRAATNTEAPKVWRPGCSNTMSTSRPIWAADVLAEAAPLRLVLGVLVGPEPVAGGLAVDHVLDAELVEQVDLVGRGHHADRGAAAVEHVLHGVAAEAAGGAPDEHGVALLHLRARWG